MTSACARVRELGLELPGLPSPAGNYIHVARSGRLLFLAGKGVGPFTGKLGRDLTVTQGYEYARFTGLTLPSVMIRELGSLDRIARIIKVVGFVNAVPDFSDHPAAIDGCSDLFVEIFGERGRHARTSIGVTSTPGQMTVELEVVAECLDDAV